MSSQVYRDIKVLSGAREYRQGSLLLCREKAVWQRPTSTAHLHPTLFLLSGSSSVADSTFLGLM
jgi:hypothetical protein